MADDLQPPAESDASAPPSDPTESLSLFEHAKRFGPNRDETAEPPQATTQAVETPPAELAEPEPEGEPTPDQQRDDQGRFVKGSHRARKHDAQVRIDDLTRKLRETESALQALRTQPTPAPPRVEPPSPPPPRPQDVPRPEPAPPPTPVKTRPKPDDFQDYGEYIEALTDWKNETYWQQREAARQQQEQAAQQQREQERLRSEWTRKVEAAKHDLPDFDTVALETPTAIPPGSLIDAWILEHPSGARVLYELQKNPPTLQALLSQPPIVQVEQLALLSDRLRKPLGSGAVTGAPPGPGNGSTPRPPTPVRTVAVTRGSEPPDIDGMGLREFAKAFPTRGRRH